LCLLADPHFTIFTEQRTSLELPLPEAFADECAAAFYDELFRLIPAAKTMFRSEAHMQRMFGIAISVILREADDPRHLKDQLRRLGVRHRHFGILPIHLKIGRQTFLNAVDRSAPNLHEPGRKFFERAFDGIADAMTGRA
jgi:hemoglobin-like flavoprotein